MPLMPMPPIPMKCTRCDFANIVNRSGEIPGQKHLSTLPALQAKVQRPKPNQFGPQPTFSKTCANSCGLLCETERNIFPDACSHRYSVCSRLKKPKVNGPSNFEKKLKTKQIRRFLCAHFALSL